MTLSSETPDPRRKRPASHRRGAPSPSDGRRPCAARLVEIARSKSTDVQHAIAAIREVLNRAGVSPQPVAEDGANGLVLWDEFIQIHRRRVQEEPGATLEGPYGGG